MGEPDVSVLGPVSRPTPLQQYPIQISVGNSSDEGTFRRLAEHIR